MNTTPRTRKTKQKRERNPVATRTKLLQATIDLVTEKGPEALSLKEAASRAKVSRGVAYLHFNDRDHLLKEAKSWIANRLREGVKHMEGAPLHERITFSTKIVLDHPEAAKLMIMGALAGRDLDPNAPLYKLVAGLIKEQKTLGNTRPDVDPEILTYIHFGSIAATLMLAAQHKGDDVDELAERFATEWHRILSEGMFTKARRGKSVATRTTGRRRVSKKTSG